MATVEETLKTCGNIYRRELKLIKERAENDFDIFSPACYHRHDKNGSSVCIIRKKEKLCCIDECKFYKDSSYTKQYSS